MKSTTANTTSSRLKMTRIKNQRHPSHQVWFRSLKMPKRERNLILIITPITLVLLGCIIAWYFWILAPQQNKQYLSAVTAAYNKQSAAMNLAFKTLSDPIFTSSSTTPAEYGADLANIGATIKAASALTDNLGSSDHLNILPGTQWLRSVSSTTKQFNAMQQYVNASRTFLVNYQLDLNYLSEFNEIKTSVQLSAFSSSLREINKSVNADQLLSAASSASAELDTILNSFSALNVPIDFQAANASPLQDLRSANNAFIDTVAGIKNENAEQVINSINALDQAASLVQAFVGTRSINGFGSNYLVYEEMVMLQATHPLINP